MQLNFGWHILVISHHSFTRTEMLSAPLFATSAPIKHHLYTKHIRGDNRSIIGCYSIHTWIFSCEGKTSRVECSAGTYAAAGSTKCTKCPKGAHCPTKTLETYILCANGTYTDTEGSSDCKLCDAGFRCPNVGMKAPLVCPNGTYSNTTGAVECILCPAGYRWGWVFFHWHISFAHHQSNINDRKFVKTKEIVFIVDYIYSLCQWRRAFLGCP